MSLSHSFSVEVAKQYDVNTALLLQHFSFWYLKNKSDKNQFFNGDYWVRMKVKQLHEYFPYLTERQLRYSLKKLLESGLLIQDEFNHDKSNRTKWYCLTKSSKTLMNIEFTKLSTRSDKIVNSRGDKIVTSIYKEEDIERRYIYSKASEFLKKNATQEFEVFVMQNKRLIQDFDRFLEYFDLKVESEELEFTVKKLMARLKILKFNWKGDSKVLKMNQNIGSQPLTRKRIG